MLFAALFVLVPYIPSHDGYRHEAMPSVILATAAFGGSRILRWRSLWSAALLEIALFALFAWILIRSYNLI